MWKWISNSDTAKTFLQAILPYLIIKKSQALLAISWQDTKIKIKSGPKPKETSPDVALYLQNTKKVVLDIKAMKR